MPRTLPVLVALSVLSLGSARADRGWTPLWNGKDLDGWTTWMQQPPADVGGAGLKRDANGRYLEPIGSGRDPLQGLHRRERCRRPAGDPDFRRGLRRAADEARRSRTTTCGCSSSGARRSGRPATAPTTQRDSGLLYHVHAAPGADGRTWARSIELQIQEHDVGDLYAVGSVIAVRAKARPGTPAGALRLRPGRRVDLLLAEPGLAGPLHQAARQREADRRVEHGRADRLQRRRDSHRQRQGGDAPARAATDRHRRCRRR